MENPIFAEIVSNPTRDIKTLDGKPIHLKNTNKLFGRYDGCIGVKTGTTRAAGGCLASAVVRNGMRIYLVIMKCEPARERTDESIVLYNKGFEMLRTLKIVNKKNNKDKKQASKGNGNVGKDGRDKRPVPKLRQGSINHDEMMKHQQVVPNRNKHD
jgi:D-alanyl-D-alanine carboxypeptidase